MIISAIVAIGQDNAIGKDNKMPWHLSADLKYFKKTTINHHIIMGRKSYNSIGNPLPKRTNIVLTRDPFWMASNVLVSHSIDEALLLAYENEEEEVFIIGGGKIYEQTKDLWDRVYITEVDVHVPDADTYFPVLDMDDWILHSEDPHSADDKNLYDYNFKVYHRK